MSLLGPREHPARARSRSAGVSTPKGACSTRAQAMRMPASSARSCSRLLALLERAFGQGHEARQRGAAKGVDADMVPQRPLAARGSRRGRNRARARRRGRVEGAGRLDDEEARGLLGLRSARPGSRCRSPGSASGRQHGADLHRRDGRQVALQVDHHVVPPCGSSRPARPAHGPSRAAERGRLAPRCRRRRGPPRRSLPRHRRRRRGRYPPRRARSSTCTIIGMPAISARGLPGSRKEAMREGIMMIGAMVLGQGEGRGAG